MLLLDLTACHLCWYLTYEVAQPAKVPLPQFSGGVADAVRTDDCQDATDTPGGHVIVQPDFFFREAQWH